MNNLIGSTSFLINNINHIRVYTIKDGILQEKCWDKDKWFDGALNSKQFKSSAGGAATSWVDSNNAVHFRVYGIDSNGNIIEYYNDAPSDWGQRPIGYSAASIESAISWINSDGTSGIRVYTYDANNTAKEYGNDGNGWYLGTYKP